jgi:hypothetical protein
MVSDESTVMPMVSRLSPSRLVRVTGEKNKLAIIRVALDQNLIYFCLDFIKRSNKILKGRDPLPSLPG